MTAGIPGTGIGGIFYVVLTLLMPLRELTRERASTRAGWYAVSRQLALGTGMVSALLIQGWALKAIVVASSLTASADGSTLTPALNTILPGLNYAPFLVLAIVVGGLEIVRQALGRRRGLKIAHAAG
jgi:hypothetical protein